MKLNTLTKEELRKTLPSIKKRIEWQPTPVTRLSRQEKAERLQELRSIIGSKQLNQPDVDQENNGG